MSFYSVREDPENGVVYREVKAMPTKLQQVFRRGFMDYMAALKKRARHEVLHGKKTGRVYWIRGNWGSRRLRPNVRRRKHQSSAPGETHANLTGRALRSISFKVHGHERAEFGYGVASNESQKAPFYATYLEFGTPKGQMKPRPTLQNAIKAVEPEPFFDKAMEREFHR